MPADVPLVSIVIPAFNHADYLNEAIGSVLAQDYPRVELIVLDDGSTDGTPEVLRGYGDQFRWESQNNIGQSATLARGWAMTRGEILGYLSADDVLVPHAVSKAVAHLEARPDAVATYCDFNLIDPHSRVVRRVTTPDYDYRAMLVTVTCPLGPGAFFRRSAYEKAGPWDPTLRQMPDYDFWLRLGLEGPFIRIPQVLAAFRVHASSQSYSRASPERAAEPVIIVNRVLQRPELSLEMRQLSGCALSNAYLIGAQLHLRAGRLAAACRFVASALRSSPAAVLSPRALRLLVNAAINRPGHRLLWTVKALFPQTGGRRR